MTTSVYYYVPEDKEDQNSLNFFIIYKKYDEVRLEDIKSNFPLIGRYYFRFKFNFNNKNVWLDFNNPEAKLPLYDGKIIMKVNRLSWESKLELQNNTFPEI